MLLGVDVGGTFTDAALLDRSLTVHTAKVPTTPSDQSVGVLAAVSAVLHSAAAQPADVARFAHGMTVATNALLEGRAARTALIATEGFTDVIELGRQARAHLYRLCDAAAPPLVAPELRFGAAERTGPDGVLRELEQAPTRRLVEKVAGARPQAVAVCLLHSYADPRHERALLALLGELVPGAHVSVSSDLVGTFREYERTATTVLDAALSPLLAAYLGGLAGEARRIGLPAPLVMQSSGGLTDVARAGSHAALTVLSGPAGGVGGALRLAALAAEPDVLCLDMGGTSCDVCVIEAGHVAETAERTVAGRPLSLPALDIHTVGAGGGSIAWRDPGGALRVGPQSAGAEPGPACYGLGGEEPTVTDADLLLGRLLDDTPLAGGLALDRAAAQGAVAALAADLGLTPLQCAEGIVRVAEANMLAALRLMTVERGLDPRGFALLAFGGAGPLHAASLAGQLGISHVLCPRDAGVLCALGLAAAAPRRDVARTLMLGGSSLSDEALREARARLAADACAQLGDERAARVRVRHELRYRRQAFELAVDEELAAGEQDDGLDALALCERFAGLHERRYGYRDAGAEVELVTMRASAWGGAPELRPRAPAGRPERGRTRRPAVFAGVEREALVLRGMPPQGESISGPAVCALAEATLLVPPGWRCTADEHGIVHLRREPADPA
jgi:N-methylhydantoinase A